MKQKPIWTFTEDELDRLAAHAHYTYKQARIDCLSPGSRVEPWGELSYGDRNAWRDVVAATLLLLDKMENLPSPTVKPEKNNLRWLCELAVENINWLRVTILLRGRWFSWTLRYPFQIIRWQRGDES